MSPQDPAASQDRIDRWREAVLTAGLAVFDWDVPARRIYRSPEMLSAWDYPEGPNETVGGARTVIHPDDFPAFWTRMTEMESGALARAVLEIRMRARDGSWRWVRWRARVASRGEDGLPSRIVGTVNDIDELWKGRDLARESQLRLQGIVDSAMDAIISVDSEQRITLFNRAAERIFGFEPREVLGQPLEMLIPARFHHGHRKHVEAYGLTGVSSRPMMAQRIVTALRRSGEEFPIDASISQNEIRGRIFFTVILRDVSVRERTRRELAQAREDLRELSVASRTAREQENSRISRELHDELGQNLTSLKMDLAWLEANCPQDDPRIGSTLAGMRSVLDSTVAATRRISADLRPLMLDDLGLLAALEWLAEETARRHGYAVELAVDPESENLAEPLASQVYRIVQESLTNAGRHAAAHNVRVSLRTIGPEIHLDVEDDGRGLEPENLRKKGSFGLVGIRERVYILAGSVEIRGDAGRGTAIHVRLPIPADRDEGEKTVTHVLVADDHAIVREGLKRILEGQEGIEIAGEATNGHEVLERVRAGGFDLLLLDLSMPGKSGIELIKQVKDERPKLPILVLTMHEEDQYAVRAIRAGASGFLTKESAPGQLVSAIRRLAEGRLYISPNVAEQLALDVRPRGDEEPHRHLSDREFEVMRLLVSGRSVSDIAAQLHLSVKTVSTHKTRILQKMSAASVADLVRYAIRHRITSDPPAKS